MSTSMMASSPLFQTQLSGWAAMEAESVTPPYVSVANCNTVAQVCLNGYRNKRSPYIDPESILTVTHVPAVYADAHTTTTVVYDATELITTRLETVTEIPKSISLPFPTRTKTNIAPYGRVFVTILDAISTSTGSSSAATVTITVDESSETNLRRSLRSENTLPPTHDSFDDFDSALSGNEPQMNDVKERRFKMDECPFAGNTATQSMTTTFVTIVRRESAVSSVQSKSLPGPTYELDGPSIDDTAKTTESIEEDTWDLSSAAPSATETSTIHYNSDLAATPEFPYGAKPGRSDAVPPAHIESSLKYFAIGVGLTVVLLLCIFICYMNCQSYRRRKLERKVMEEEAQENAEKGIGIAR